MTMTMTAILAGCGWFLVAAAHLEPEMAAEFTTAEFTEFIGGSTAVDNNTTHDGTVISASAGKLLLAKAGGHEASYSIGEDARISRNGEPAKLEDFRAGDAVRVTVDESGAVVALSTIDVDKHE